MKTLFLLNATLFGLLALLTGDLTYLVLQFVVLASWGVVFGYEVRREKAK